MEKKKYFKIVNPNGHYGLIYKEGYNEDPLPFYPAGDCEPGGIYFASEDIFAFVDFGTDVYEVEPIGEIYKNPGTPRKFKAHAVNLRYIGKVYEIETIEYLISHGADIHAHDEEALKCAAKYDCLEMVKYLVERGADIHAEDDYALRWAAEKGHYEIVKYLVEKGADIHALEDYAFRWAAYKGHYEIVKYLIERGADIHAQNERILIWAAWNGHLEIVKYLKEKMLKS